MAILSLVLRHGLLCTPERFGLYPNYNTTNSDKKQYLEDGRPYAQVVQSRACFTLSEAIDLSKEYAPTPARGGSRVTHSDLFGEFAIGLDAVEARMLNIIPVVYYYRYDHALPASPSPGGGKRAGLAAQIVERLDELRNLMAVLSHLESVAHPSGGREGEFPSRTRLAGMGIRVACEDAVERALGLLSESDAARVYRLFDTDRPPAWNVFDFLQMMLSLYQTADSTVEDAPLAFFQQREWRLIHHMMEGQVWFGLGNHPASRDPFAKTFGDAIGEIRAYLRRSRPSWKEETFDWFCQHSWVFHHDRGLHFRDYVREVVVPPPCVDRVRSMLAGLDFVREPPAVTALPARWRLVTDQGIPRIEHGLTE